MPTPVNKKVKTINASIGNDYAKMLVKLKQRICESQVNAAIAINQELILYHREGKAITSFKHMLLPPQLDLAQQITRSSYCFQFLSPEKNFREKEPERSLTDHMLNLLSELGRGFAFVSRQCPLEVDGKAFLIDLLLYRTTLDCYIVVELKTGEFQPEFTGKINFYLGAVDRLLKKENDRPSIDFVLCKSKSKTQGEIALQAIKKPIGVARYVVGVEQIVPKELLRSLPTIKELEEELGGGEPS